LEKVPTLSIDPLSTLAPSTISYRTPPTPPGVRLYAEAKVRLQLGADRQHYRRRASPAIALHLSSY